MTRTVISERARVVALVVTAFLLAAVLIGAGIGQQSKTLNAGAATAGIVHIEMKVTGQKTGVFKGDSTLKGHEDQIVVTAYVFELISPRDPATGLASGKRQYRPITITKLLNASSPQVLNACATNENLKSVVINFWRTERTGVSINFYRVTLTNANISQVKQYSSGDTVLEDVSLTFQKIQQEDLIAKTIFEDTWSSVA